MYLEQVRLTRVNKMRINVENTSNTICATTFYIKVWALLTPFPHSGDDDHNVHENYLILPPFPPCGFLQGRTGL
jgi:hypothetical protein